MCLSLPLIAALREQEQQETLIITNVLTALDTSDTGERLFVLPEDQLQVDDSVRPSAGKRIEGFSLAGRKIDLTAT